MMVDFQGVQRDIAKHIGAIPSDHKDRLLLAAIMTLCTVVNHGLHGVAEAIELHRNGFGSST